MNLDLLIEQATNREIRGREEGEKLAVKMGYTWKEIIKCDKHKSVANARAIIQYYLYEDVGLSSSEIGILMKRDHSSVLNNIDKIKKKLNE